MPVKIRLQRQGRKFQAIYSIVVADSRAPRDGKYIENLGQYNPNTNPATIELDFDKAIEWLQKGAQPTDTCRAILSYKGVLYKKHLLEGVKKGAFDEAEAEKRFQSWLTEKEQKIQAKVDKIKKTKDQFIKDKLERESKISEDRAIEIAKKMSELAEEEKAEEVVEEVAAEEAAPEVAESAAPETAETAEAEPEAQEAEAAAEEEPVKEEKVEAEAAEEPEKAEEESKGEPEAETEKPADEPVDEAAAEEEAPEEEKAEEKKEEKKEKSEEEADEDSEKK